MHVSQKHAINNFTISNRRLGAEPKNFDQTELQTSNFLTKIELHISSVKTRQKSGRTELLTISNFKVCTNTEQNQVRVNTTLILRIR